MIFGKKPKIKYHIQAIMLAWILTLIMAAGCSSPRGEIFPELQQPLLWPEPPEKPRIKYIGQLTSEDDLKREVSSMKALGNLIFGRDPIGVFARPYAVSKDDKQKLYIADSSGSVIHCMDIESREYMQFYKLNDTNRLISPIGLALADEKIFVADSILAQICVFDMQGNYLLSFGSEFLQRPSGLSYSKNQKKLYVADSRLHAVLIFDLQGNHLGKLGQQGADYQQFNYPTHLWVDKDDKLYVSDTLNYRVQIFDPQGRHLLSIGKHGNRPGYFAHPCGIATDTFGNIYVSDKQFENIQIFNSEGQILMSFGDEGNDPGQFWLPAGIFIDDENRIYVADSFNKRIQVFQLLEGQVK